MSTETAEDVRRSISLAMGWANVPPTDVLVRDAGATRRALGKLQRHLAVLSLHADGKQVDHAELKEAQTVAKNLAQALSP